MNFRQMISESNLVTIAALVENLDLRSETKKQQSAVSEAVKESRLHNAMIR